MLDQQGKLANILPQYRVKYISLVGNQCMLLALSQRLFDIYLALSKRRAVLQTQIYPHGSRIEHFEVISQITIQQALDFFVLKRWYCLQESILLG